MARIEKEVTVNASITRVFDFLSMPGNLPEIWPSLVRVEHIEPLPNYGYKAKYEYKMAGLRFTGEGKYVDIAWNQWLVIKSTGGVPSTITFSFRELETRTQVHVVIDYEIPIPLLNRLAEYIVLKMNEADIETMMHNLGLRFIMDY